MGFSLWVCPTFGVVVQQNRKSPSTVLTAHNGTGNRTFMCNRWLLVLYYIGCEKQRQYLCCSHMPINGFHHDLVQLYSWNKVIIIIIHSENQHVTQSNANLLAHQQSTMLLAFQYKQYDKSVQYQIQIHWNQTKLTHHGFQETTNADRAWDLTVFVDLINFDSFIRNRFEFEDIMLINFATDDQDVLVKNSLLKPVYKGRIYKKMKLWFYHSHRGETANPVLTRNVDMCTKA